ncbi:MAG TPA: uroporphyrinogen-III C-methyltransferase [Candidatus Eisenbacteria bacterium]|nr:uroporphyrinogen-III C-methyltransferase [Candidatus Eisenbacteria bacterium]
MKGKAYLVGAGPGDPGLLTVKACRLLGEADLIVYDYLANPAHLRHAKKGAATLCVGERFRYRTLSQDRINRLIVDAARKGKTVVRLKGGDPYLFGRGGEEALFLERHGVPFEVVPGVTSATACAGYAGIPLTHRDHNSSVTFLTGHRADDENLDTIDWKSLVSLGGTLVIYMGFYNLERIARRLMQCGMPAAMPVSVIEWGTLPRQRSCDGTLAGIGEAVRRRKLHAPCVIIVGEVVSLRKKLNWFERLPLFGKKILVTRTREKSASLREKLESLGAEVLEFPAIEILPPAGAGRAALDRAAASLPDNDWVVFSSAHAVEALFSALAGRKKDVRAFGGVKIASVGPATSRALRERGLSPDLEPARFESSAVAEEFRRRFGRLEGRKILLPSADIAPRDLEHSLSRLGADVRRVTAYRTRTPKKFPADVRKALSEGVDFVTFTSASTVRHFVRALGRAAARKAARRACLASIGPVTSRELRANGLRAGCQAKEFTVDGLVAAMKNRGSHGLSKRQA